MTEELSVAITGREAGRFADFTSMVSDLSFVVEACTRLAALMALPQEEQDQLAMRALWVSSLIAYRRCFTSGKGQIVRNARRSAIPDSVMSKLDPDLQSAHSTFLNIADKRAISANSVGPAYGCPTAALCSRLLNRGAAQARAIACG